MTTVSMWTEGWRVMHRVFLYVFSVLVAQTIAVVVSVLAFGSPIVLVDRFLAVDLQLWMEIHELYLAAVWLVLFEPLVFYGATKLSGEFQHSPIRWRLKVV